MWNGPAPEHAFNKSLFTNWHYRWRYSGGDIANDAIHQLDLARWLLGVDLPETVYSTGGLYSGNTSAKTSDAAKPLCFAGIICPQHEEPTNELGRRGQPTHDLCGVDTLRADLSN